MIEAIEILKAANDSLQADEFVTKIDEYEKYRPKSLAEMEPMSKGNNVGFSDDGVVKDTFGNSYTGYVLFETWNGKKNESSAVVPVQGYYSKLKGTLVCKQDMALDKSVGIKIYADGQVIYESELINPTSDPIYFELDITGIKTLKLESVSPSEKAEDYNSKKNPHLIIVDSLLYN